MSEVRLPIAPEHWYWGVVEGWARERGQELSGWLADLHV